MITLSDQHCRLSICWVWHKLRRVGLWGIFTVDIWTSRCHRVWRLDNSSDTFGSLTPPFRLWAHHKTQFSVQGQLLFFTNLRNMSTCGLFHIRNQRFFILIICAFLVGGWNKFPPKDKLIFKWLPKFKTLGFFGTLEYVKHGNMEPVT